MSIKLLLADESITIRKVFQKVFSESDYEIAWIDRHDEILESVKNLKPDFVLLSDTFPGVNLETDIKEIAGVSSHPRSVIVMAHHGDSIDSETSALWGAAGFVYKPLDNRILKSTIDELLRLGTQPADSPAGTAQTSTQSAGITSTRLHIPDTPADTLNRRAKILFDIFESYFNENLVILSDSMTKTLAPRIAADISSRIIEHLQITDLPKQIMKMTKGIVNDLVPQIAERVVAREIESIKAEAIRLLEEEDIDDDDNV
jgi:DNA-binding NarL/FixJ family response regulator